jgi:hypothetical protein
LAFRKNIFDHSASIGLGHIPKRDVRNLFARMDSSKMVTGDFRIVDTSVKKLVASEYPEYGGKKCFENVWIGLNLPFGILGTGRVVSTASKSQKRQILLIEVQRSR